MNDQEPLYAIALSQLQGVSQPAALYLYRQLGSAYSVYEHRGDISDVIDDVSPHLVRALSRWDEALSRAEAELAFTAKYAIQVLPYNSPLYPARLRECPDAPLVLYYRGTADLNQRHIVSIVGTRRATQYGFDLIRRFTSRLKELCPQVLIVSGLAYGIDICAHHEALAHGYETVAVLAHGFEKIYPTQHRDTAMQMVRQGGLLTEYMSHAFMDKSNFVRRNRIVAGMADATILVESAAKGGGLITCEIAQSYDRQVFAFPGAVGAPYSEGCNRLIRDNGAGLITTADDFVTAIGWQTATDLRQAQASGIERDLFPNLSDEERQVVTLLDQSGDLQLNQLAVKSDLSIGQLNTLLFQLEMKGVVKPLAGGNYHLLK